LGAFGQTLGSQPPFGMSFSALGAAALCLLNFVWAYTSLSESLPSEKRGVIKKRTSRIKEIARQIRRPVAGALMWVYFLSGLAMAQMEAMLFPYVADVYGWGLKTASYGFAYVGVLMVITQGWLIRRWMPRFGEGPLLIAGLTGFSLSLIAIPYSVSVAALGGAMTLLAVGNGLMRPPNLGLISLLTPSDEQGVAMGVTNSLASLGRIIGPALGGVLYERLGHASPFLSAGVLAAGACLIVVALRTKLPSSKT